MCPAKSSAHNSVTRSDAARLNDSFTHKRYSPPIVITIPIHMFQLHFFFEKNSKHRNYQYITRREKSRFAGCGSHKHSQLLHCACQKKHCATAQSTNQQYLSVSCILRFPRRRFNFIYRRDYRNQYNSSYYRPYTVKSKRSDDTSALSLRHKRASPDKCGKNQQ